MKVICREADNVMEALSTAQGMEKAGASVFSVTHNGMRHPQGAMIPSSSFIVWAKYDDPLTPDMIDEKITAALNHS